MKVSFQYGTTTAYGQSDRGAVDRGEQRSDAVRGELTGLPAGTTIHYRAVAVSDFGTFVGADQTLTTASAPPPSPGPTTAASRHANRGEGEGVGLERERTPLVQRPGRHELPTSRCG